jgi:lipoprotein-anchoring transpeptidase ErfK/SrfK
MFTHIYALPSRAVDIFLEYKKVIWIDQIQQVGAAYEQGEKLCEFPVITGDDETPTPPGIYVVKVKDADYYSRTYYTPVSYSIFFDFKGKRAIHEGEVPDPRLEERVSNSRMHPCGAAIY